MITTGRRLIIATVLAICASALTPVAVQASSQRMSVRLGAPSQLGHADTSPLDDPASNTEPSQAFYNACYDMGTTKTDNDSCDAAAVKDFNNVRASEGLGPMTLPGDFDTLTVPAQLLAISNIERIDRGLVAISGLSSSLDTLAQTGADNDADPEFPQPCNCDAGGSNWAGAGNSALLDDFFWMYDDGLGSGNEDCTQADMSGCWGHRHDIISPNALYDAPLVMGAAVTYGTQYGTSMTEEFLSGDSTDTVDVTPTWSTIAATTPVSLSATSIAVTADTAKKAHAALTVTATYDDANVGDSITAGNSSWSVSPTSCALSVGDACTLHLTFDPASSGKHAGSLIVTGPNGNQVVALAGMQEPPRLTIAANHTRVARHHAAKITGTVTSHTAHVAVAHERVQLQTRRGHGSWHNLATLRSGTSGTVQFTVHPAGTATYRLKALANNGAAEALSAHRKITVG